MPPLVRSLSRHIRWPEFQASEVNRSLFGVSHCRYTNATFYREVYTSEELSEKPRYVFLLSCAMKHGCQI